jgi:Kef-type K+ transport system membrane component KefB
MHVTGEVSEPAGKRRLVIFYVILAVITAAGVIYVIGQGKDEKSQPRIAGGYDAAAPTPCLGKTPPPTGAPLPATAPGQPAVAGPSFDVKQSGQFVNLSNVQNTLGGKLRLHTQKGPNGGHLLTGTVNCVNGKDAKFRGYAAPRPAGTITGTLGGVPLTANLRRDPPDPGTPKPRVPGSVAAVYKLSPRSTCFGGLMTLSGSGTRYTVKAGGNVLGTVSYKKDTGALAGDVKCTRGGTARFRAVAVDRNLNNVTVIPLDAATPAKAPAGAAPKATVKPALTTPSGLPPAGERFTGTQQRDSFGKLVAAFLIAVAIVMLIARLFGLVAQRLGQPRVMGEVVAGITLGPSVLGAISPNLQAELFPSDILPAFGVAANLGVIFYVFLIGLEFDPGQLRGRVTQAAAISNASVALPMVLGIAVALPIYKILGPDIKFVAFALFMGVAMSITAFPVLARILVERRMLKRPVGALTLASAAIDDVTAWFLIALATTIAVAGTFGDVVETIGLAVGFCLLMGLVIRPLIGRVSTAFDQVGRVPAGWVAAIFAGVLVSAYVTEEIGIAVIFGAFIMGMIMPRNARLTEDVTRRLEDFVVVLLLPLFFAYTGLKTNIGLLDQPVLWWITLALIAVAIVGKLFGAMIAARVAGFDWRASTVIGTLMNTRGLTELIVLNLALEKGAISDTLFAMLVIMALVTTFMAGPMLRLLDPRNEYGTPVEEELEESKRQVAEEFPGVAVPERSILVAPQTDAALPQLLALAEPLARSEPPRELILARLVQPPRSTPVRGGLQTENALLQRASNEIAEARKRLVAEGIPTRGVAFSSGRPGADLARLAEAEEVDLVLVEGSRPLRGEGVPLGHVKDVLQEASSDVAVLVAREGDPIELSPDAPILVPFGGAQHDWSALELGAWLAAQTKAPLKLLGAAGQTEEGKSVTRLLGDASLLVQQTVGIGTEPLVAEGGREGVLAAAEGASLLVVGLSDRWRDEGLGPTRSEIAKAAPAPVLFVRRGSRPGALAPRSDVTRFTWSSAGAPAPGGSG